MAAILIVDDEPNCRKPLATLLRCEGYQITEASDGIEALQKLREKPHNLVLLDMMMPGLDGVTVLQSLRRQEKFARLPVLMVTHQHDPRKLELARKIGFQEYIFKGDTPFAKILELIKRHLGEHFVPRRRGRKPKHRPDTAPPGVMTKPTPPKRRYTEFQLRFLSESLRD